MAKIKVKWFYLLSGLFILLNSFLIIREQYWGVFIPVMIIVVLMYIFWLDKLLLFIVFLTPLAINIADQELGVGISIPTEPLLVGILLVFILKTLFNSNYDRRILRHPVSIAVFFSLFWILVTTLTSELPLVSLKFLLARLWFVIPFYFLGVALFKKASNINQFNWLYVGALLIVIAYTTIQHSFYSFAEEQGHWVMKPFYNDHTAYGAILAFFLPVFVGYTFHTQRSSLYRLIAGATSFILVVALFLSSSRAAWISVASVVIVALMIVFRIKLRWILTTVIVVVASFYIFQTEILYVLEKNKQDSSENFVEHIKSIYNISSDASNLERINRWQSAFRMYSERPVVGWGPGTYQFIYAPFQRSQDRTIISTNAGDLGNAHSEYIGPLSEQGLVGMIAIFGLMATVLYTGIKVYKQARSKEIKLLSLVAVLSLVTYFVHGVLNNFLDTDKASIPFWGFFAMIVAMDLYHKKEEVISNEPSITNNTYED